MRFSHKKEIIWCCSKRPRQTDRQAGRQTDRQLHCAFFDQSISHQLHRPYRFARLPRHCFLCIAWFPEPICVKSSSTILDSRSLVCQPQPYHHRVLRCRPQESKQTNKQTNTTESTVSMLAKPENRRRPPIHPSLHSCSRSRAGRPRKDDPSTGAQRTGGNRYILVLPFSTFFLAPHRINHLTESSHRITESPFETNE